MEGNCARRWEMGSSAYGSTNLAVPKQLQFMNASHVLSYAAVTPDMQARSKICTPENRGM